MKAAESIKIEQDLNDFSRLLKKITVEAALGAELDEHLGYDKHQLSDSTNSRNGYSSKTLISEDGPFEIDVPRDRDGSFEPQLVKKQQRRFTGMDDKILLLYAQGMTTGEIVAAFKDLYDANVSATLVSRVTDAAIEQVVEWQSRPLDAVYPIVYLVRIFAYREHQIFSTVNTEFCLTVNAFALRQNSVFTVSKISQS